MACVLCSGPRCACPNSRASVNVDHVLFMITQRHTPTHTNTQHWPTWQPQALSADTSSVSKRVNSNRCRTALPLSNLPGADTSRFARVRDVNLQRLGRVISLQHVRLPQEHCRHLRVMILHLDVLEVLHVGVRQAKIHGRFGFRVCACWRVCGQWLCCGCRNSVKVVVARSPLFASFRAPPLRLRD